jgi:integrase/recombinase XerD
VRRLFEYLEMMNRILVNPAEKFKEPKKETRLPRVVLTAKETRRILDAPNLSLEIGIRDRAILEVFYSTGIRLGELLRLTIFDCDLQGGLLRVNNGKGAKDRVVPLGRHAVKFLQTYLAKVRPRYTSWKRAERCLFVGRLGVPLSQQAVQKMVRNYARAAGIRKKVTPHTFRHTFATELVRNGAEITAVQKMLGHADLSVTQLYTHVAGVEVKKTHRLSHPRERDAAVKEDIAPDIRTVKEPRRRD